MSSVPHGSLDTRKIVTPSSLPSSDFEGRESPGGFQSNLPSTFTGQNGGSAEDAELLAELRKISDQSSTGDRFSSVYDKDDNGSNSYSQMDEKPNVPTDLEKSVLLEKEETSKPWKKGKRSQKRTTAKPSTVGEISSATGAESSSKMSSSPPLPTGRTSPGGFKSTSTFSG